MRLALVIVLLFVAMVLVKQAKPVAVAQAIVELALRVEMLYAMD
jgi:hypothetical protein